MVLRLQEELIKRGQHQKAIKNWKAYPEKNLLKLSNGTTLEYGHLFNCAGLQADRVAHQFGIGKHYSLLPFKGLYWQLKPGCPIRFNTNLYPVPDLNVPFLGVHFTPSADAIPLISIGPTATPAWGRENYRGLNGLELGMVSENLQVLARQYLANQGGFRRYVHEQAFLALPPLLVRAAQELIPGLRAEHIEMSQKVSVQLFNKQTQHLKTISCALRKKEYSCFKCHFTAFTASFEL